MISSAHCVFSWLCINDGFANNVLNLSIPSLLNQALFQKGWYISSYPSRRCVYFSGRITSRAYSIKNLKFQIRGSISKKTYNTEGSIYSHLVEQRPIKNTIFCYLCKEQAEMLPPEIRLQASVLGACIIITK